MKIPSFIIIVAPPPERQPRENGAPRLADKHDGFHGVTVQTADGDCWRSHGVKSPAFPPQMRQMGASEKPQLRIDITP